MHPPPAGEAVFLRFLGGHAHLFAIVYHVLGKKASFWRIMQHQGGCGCRFWGVSSSGGGGVGEEARTPAVKERGVWVV